jgi:hypothetical protein
VNNHLPETTIKPTQSVRRLSLMTPLLLSASLLLAGCNEGSLGTDGLTAPPSAGQPPADTASPQTGQVPVADRSVTLSWDSPTLRADGSPLNDLAGFRILYGDSSEKLDTAIELDNPGLSGYVVDGLQPGTWYFAMTVVDHSGVQSDPSPILEVTLN